MPPRIHTRNVRMSLFLLLLSAGQHGWCGPAAALDGAAYDNPNGNTRVVCLADPSQSYELYIPPTAPATGPAPICYGFDPGGNGKATLLQLAPAALENGWILAVSNNSKNGPWADIFIAQDAVLLDTETRLNLSPTRRFAGGMSGGARASLALAYRYPAKICGTLLVAAGGPFGTSLAPSTNRLVVHILIGTEDSNYLYDVPETQGALVDAGIRCVVTPFAGGHVWPSGQLVLSGCRWLNDNAEKDPNSGLAPPVCRPSSLFCQAPPPPGGAWGAKVADSEYAWTAFERFNGAVLPVAAVEWWGISAVWNSNVGYWLPSDPGARTFRVSLHPDNAGVPGPPVHAELLTASREDFPHLYSRNYALRRFRALLSAPVNLPSGWVGIQHVRTGDTLELLMASYEGDGQYLHYENTYGTYAPEADDLAIAVGTEEMEGEIFASPNLGHPPLAVRFTGVVSGNVGPVVNWRWDFGDGDILEGVEPAPSHVYTDPGVYSVSLTVSTDLSSTLVERHALIVVSEALPLAGPAGLAALAAACLALGAARPRLSGARGRAAARLAARGSGTVRQP